MTAAERYTLKDLRELMARLRDPADGCPWDLQQKYRSIAPFTLEECYELADAIESNDRVQIRQELGDLLFQVVFYCQLAEEAGDFSWAEVVHDITAKLLRRHPHVFPDGSLSSRADADTDVAAVKSNWEAIKAEERAEKAQHSLMDDIPIAMPALNRAVKLQKRAASVGFDWSDAKAVFAKIDEEVAELQQEISAENPAAIADEFGDLLLAVTNLGRKLGVEPESALREANRRFERRFRWMESERGGQQGLKGLDNVQLEALWDSAKKNLSD